MLTHKEIVETLVWWKTPSTVDPIYLLQKIMNMGTWEMWLWAKQEYTSADFNKALDTARKGDFSLKSWHYWHLILGKKLTPLVGPASEPVHPTVSFSFET